MKSSSGALVRRLTMMTALPAALLLGAGTASAQWGQRQGQRQGQGQGQGQGKQLPRSGYGYGGGQQELFEWQGPVDREIRIQLSGNRAFVERVGNNERAGNRVRTTGGVPSQDGIVTIQKFDGRGNVDVVQQPTRGNGFTTIVRLRDPQSGAGMYRIAAYWQPTGNSGVYRNGRQGTRSRDGDDNNGGYNNGGYNNGDDNNGSYNNGDDNNGGYNNGGYNNGGYNNGGYNNGGNHNGGNHNGQRRRRGDNGDQ